MVKKVDRTFPITKRLIIGCSIAVLLLLAGSWILAAVTVSSAINRITFRYMITLIILMSSSAGTAITIRGEKHNILKISIVFSLIVWLILIAANALLLGGNYQGIGFTLLLLLGGSMSTSFMNLKLKGKHRRISGYTKNR